ncbi:MAG TPA: glycosyltransferase family 39 protein [Terracidiphilus sp.]
MQKSGIWIAVAVLLLMQAAQTIYVVHRESLTFDEGNHMYAGYMMWHDGDYGLNPEHPPLVKLLATSVLLGHDYWLPQQQGRYFKSEAYLNGRDWLARNDGASGHMVLKMRMAAGLLALGFSLMIFWAARAWFGPVAGLAALAIASFDPVVLANSALVTTDIAVSLFLLASVYAFYRYVKAPTMVNLVIAGVAGGLAISSKHSGVLLAPMLLVLIAWEILTAERGTRLRATGKLAAGFVGVLVIGVAVLWAFYGFRYAARPAGVTMSVQLTDTVKAIAPWKAAAVLEFAKLHLLPESYLIGMVDVNSMALFYPTFILGKMYSHGVWWYFPVALLIKSTLGLIAMVLLALFAIVTGKLRKGRELAFVILPAAVYFGAAVASGMNIGARHLMPAYTLAFVLAGAGVAAMAAHGMKWKAFAFGLIAAHALSALLVFPNYMAYANEAWGGPKNTHKLLSDANVDWAQQLYQVKAWQDRHPGEECWFAYFAYSEINPATYGITCHHLPTIDSMWLGGAEVIAPQVKGNVLISAGDWSGCEWPSGLMNPYRGFQAREPDEMIDYAVLVYRGSYEIKQAAALSRAESANELMAKGKIPEALALAREATAIDPDEVISQTSHGDAAAASGLKDEARTAWQAAIKSAQRLEPEAQLSYVPGLQRRLGKL